MRRNDGAVACPTEQTVLGEGVRWDARRGELLRVDILAGRVHRDRIDADGGLVPVRTYHLPGTVGAITTVEGDDGWLLAAGRGFLHLAPDGARHRVAEVAPPGTRMNDAARGTLSRRRVLISLAEEAGAPDGMTVDAAGQPLRPRRPAAPGARGPGPETTCCAFAGPGPHRLYVTTATEGWSDERRRADPAAGLVYRFDTDATGRAASPFRRDPSWWEAVLSGST